MLDIINLTDGVELPNQLCLVRCVCSPAIVGSTGTITHEVGGVVSITSHSVVCPDVTSCSGIAGGFTALVLLGPGTNRLVAQCGPSTATRRVVYVPPPSRHFVRLVYVTCLNEEQFQGPKEMERSSNAAVRRIQTGALVLQTFVADSLHEEGLERKTFRLELTAKGLPKVHVLQLPLTILEVQSQSEERLWEMVALQLLSSPHLADPSCKYLAMLGATRFSNATGREISSESEVLSLTRGHVSLGGGGLALVGGGALYAWAEHPADVIKAMADKRPVDSRYLMDFSGGRHTWGSCYGTNLGSALHELGHTLDLGHARHGVMARGFEDMHVFFTAPQLHCAFARHNARGNVRASLSSSSLVKAPVTFRTDFIARQQLESNIHMTVAPLGADEGACTSSDTSSSDALDHDSDSATAALRSLSYKCNLHASTSASLATPPVSVNSASASDASSPEDAHHHEDGGGCSPSLTNVTNTSSSVGNLASSSFTNLTTSLCEFDSGRVSTGDEENNEDNTRIMTASFSNLSCEQQRRKGRNGVEGSRGPKSLSSMPDLSQGGGGGRWGLGGRNKNTSVSCRAFWARANAVMLAMHKWLNDYTDGPKPQLKGSVLSASPGVRLVELRDLDTLTFHHWEWLGRPPPVLHIPWASVPKWPPHQHIHLLAVDANGNLLKDCFIPRPL